MNKRGPQIIDLMRFPLYKEIATSKHNGKILPNGHTRVGSNMAHNPKTGQIYKINQL